MSTLFCNDWPSQEGRKSKPRKSKDECTEAEWLEQEADMYLAWAEQAEQIGKFYRATAAAMLKRSQTLKAKEQEEDQCTKKNNQRSTPQKQNADSRK